MYFNRRILQEAERDNVPLLERLKFLGIYSNNLDEFFRVRVSTLKRVIEYKHESADHAAAVGRVLREITRLTRLYSTEFDGAFDHIKQLLDAQGIHIIDEQHLSDAQKLYIRMVYQNDLNSATYPLILSHGARINELTDSSIYLAVCMSKHSEPPQPPQHDFALIELPTREFGRFIKLPSTRTGDSSILFLDDMVRFCLPFIFAGLGYDTFEAYTLKFTRDAEIALDGDIDEGLIEKVARGIKSRKKGEATRLVYDRQMPPEMLRYLKKRFNIDRYDTCVSGSRYHNMKDLMDFPECGRADLHFAPHPATLIPPINLLDSILEMIRQQDVFLHYPYHSFSNYIKVLREAALSPDVHSIKTTVYRLAKDSKVVKALICAAKHGKQVTVMVELMARFDEASNIGWSKKMQDAGIEVLFGVEGMKVHSKLMHISSSKGDIACISTGNFHEGNARSYTDITLLTAHREIVREVDRVFDFIRQPYRTMRFKHLIVSPLGMRQSMLSLINHEIKEARAGHEAYITGKLNHVTDPRLIEKLYEASEAGVRIELLVRGNCSLCWGLGPRSEHIAVRGIIDRYLEHSRILFFCHSGEDRCLIGSADWMPRNFDKRIEVYTPIYDPHIRSELLHVVEYGLRDNQAARIVDGTDANILYHNGEPPFRSQKELYLYYQHQIEEQQCECEGSLTSITEQP